MQSLFLKHLQLVKRGGGWRRIPDRALAGCQEGGGSGVPTFPLPPLYLPFAPRTSQYILGSPNQNVQSRSTTASGQLREVAVPQTQAGFNLQFVRGLPLSYPFWGSGEGKGTQVKKQALKVNVTTQQRLSPS